MQQLINAAKKITAGEFKACLIRIGNKKAYWIYFRKCYIGRVEQMESNERLLYGNNIFILRFFKKELKREYFTLAELKNIMELCVKCEQSLTIIKNMEQ